MNKVPCDTCGKLTLPIEDKNRLIICENCTHEITSVGLEDYEFYLNRAIHDMVMVQKFDNPERYCFYQITSILMELRKQMNGGYMSMSYLDEKCKNLLNQATTIAKEKGFVSV